MPSPSRPHHDQHWGPGKATRVPQLGTPEPPQALPTSGQSQCWGQAGGLLRRLGTCPPTFWRAQCAGGWQREHPQLGTSLSPWTGCGGVPPNVGGLSMLGDGRESTPRSGTPMSPSGPCQGHQASSVCHRASTRDLPVPMGPQGWGSPRHPSETRRTLPGDLAPPPRALAPPSRWGCTPAVALAMLCHPCRAVSPARVPSPCPRGANALCCALLCSLPLPQASSFQTLLRQQARLEVLARRVTLLEAIIWPGNHPRRSLQRPRQRAWSTGGWRAPGTGHGRAPGPRESWDTCLD